MSLATTENRKQYTANGVNTIFPFPLKFFQETDLEVYVDADLKTLTTDYTVSGIPPGSFSSGGNVVFNSPPPNLSVVTIVRNVPFTQPSDYQDYPNYAAAADTFENDMDRRTMADQQLADLITRVLQIPVTDPIGLDMTLPSDRANTFFAFDAAKKPIAAVGMASVPVTSWAATLLDDAEALPAQATLFSESYPAASGYTPAEKDVVELLSDGTIRKMKRAAATQIAAGSQVLAVRVAALDSTRAVVLYLVGLVIYAVVATVNPRTLEVSFGAPATVFTCTSTAAAFSLAEISSNMVLAAYSVTGGSYTQLSVVTLTVSGTSIVVNTPVNGSATAQGATLKPIASSGNVLLVWAGSATTILAAVVSFVGTVPTINASATVTVTAMAALTNAKYFGLSISLAGDMAAVAFTDTGVAKVATFGISGTSTSAGNVYSSGMAQVSANYSPIEEGPPCAYTMFVDNTGVGTNAGFVVGRRSHNSNPTIDFAGSAPMVMPLDLGNAQMRGTDRESGIVLLFTCTLFKKTSERTLGVMVFAKKRGGSDSGGLAAYEFGDVYAWVPANVSGGLVASICTLSSGISVVAIGSISGSAGINAVVALKRRNMIRGVVNAAGKVQSAGILTTSGLTPGAEYGVDDDGNLSTVVGEARIGYAISATQLVLDIRRGI